MPNDSPYSGNAGTRDASGLVILAGGVEDIERLIEIDKAAAVLFAPTGLLSAAALEDHVPPEDFCHAIEAGWLFVARPAQTAVAGFVMAWPRGRGLYVAQVSVDPCHGRRGIGRALMIHLEDEAARRGIGELTLSTFRDLKWNAPFYASLGFVPLERSDFEPFMFDIEDAQAPYMDVSKRIFMRKRLRKPR